MERFIRKISVTVLLCLFLCALLPVGALADDSGSCGTGVSWSFSGSTLTIGGKGEMAGYTETDPAPWSDLADSITTVIVGEGVTHIGSLCFYNCEKLTCVILPSTLKSIGSFAFENCVSLGYISLPAALERIGEAAFRNCASLNGIRLPSGLRSVGDFAFYRCGSLTSVTVPESVVSFGMVVFAYCYKLTSAVIRCPISKLPDWTFYGCKALSSVSIPETVTETGENSFHACTKLSEIYYTGSSAAEIIDDAKQEAPYVTLVEESFTGTATTSEDTLDVNSSKGSSTVVSTTDSGNAIITETTENDYTFLVDGEEAPLSKVAEISEGKTEGDIQVETTSKTIIEATVENDDGWAEVAELITVAADNENITSVEANIQLNGTTVSGEDVADIVKSGADLTITTAEGQVWKIEDKSSEGGSFSESSYELGFAVKKEEKIIETIASDDVYRVTFAGTTDFISTVGVELEPDTAGQYVTLYEKSFLKITEIETVLVDNDGVAWFTVDGTDKSKTYYVGVNVEGVDTSKAVIPETMYEEYGLDNDTFTLMDASGKEYIIGERVSSWGITGGEFALYVGAVFGGLIVIIALVMIAINQNNRSKAKYAAMAERDRLAEESKIDEDALRLEVMQKILKETQEKNRKE